MREALAICVSTFRLPVSAVLYIPDVREKDKSVLSWSLQSQYCLFVQLGQTTHRSPGAFHTKFWKTPRKTSGAAANVFPAKPRTQVAYSHMIISTVKEGIGFLLLLCSRLEHPKQPRRSVECLRYSRTSNAQFGRPRTVRPLMFGCIFSDVPWTCRGGCASSNDVCMWTYKFAMKHQVIAYTEYKSINETPTLLFNLKDFVHQHPDVRLDVQKC